MTVTKEIVAALNAMRGDHVEINVSAQSSMMWGVNDEFYGVGCRGTITKLTGEAWMVELTGAGIYGMSDSCDSEIRGDVVRIWVDPHRASHVERRMDRIMITLNA